MSSKIIRDKSRLEVFEMPQFSKIEKGTHKYKMRPFSFDEESSVQDWFDPMIEIDPPTITTVLDEVSDDLYLPPSRRLAKAEEHIRAEKVSLFSGEVKGGTGFVESPHFIDAEEHQEEYPTRVITSGDNAGDEGSVPTSKIAELESIIATKDLEIENIKTSMALQMQTAIDEAKTDAYNKAKEENAATYTVSKSDYFETIEKFNNEAISKLDEVNTTIHMLDTDLPKLVISYLDKIIGAERKINNEFVTNLIRRNIDKLNEFKIISFSVNPTDLDIIKEKFPEIVVSTDTSINSGSIKVNTKVGEVMLDVDAMIDNLEVQMNENIESFKNA